MIFLKELGFLIFNKISYLCINRILNLQIMAFFKLPGHYVFDYKPIYYDPRKEKREKRFQNIRKELGIDEKGEELPYKADISFRSAKIDRKVRGRNSTVRLLTIFIILSVSVYFFLYTDIFEKFAQYFVK